MGITTMKCQCYEYSTKQYRRLAGYLAPLLSLFHGRLSISYVFSCLELFSITILHYCFYLCSPSVWLSPMARSRSRSRERRRRSRSRSGERKPRDRSRERDRDREDRGKRRYSRERRSRSRSPYERRRSRSRDRRGRDRDDGRRGRDSRSPHDRKRRDDRRAQAPISLDQIANCEQDVSALMGFEGFNTTKNRKVAGNYEGAVKINKPRRYRQYMNRKGGFNRPLDYIA
ncbi:hypothetical protein RB195_005401 [Necator americanus]|uniref:U4/U6.U5 small nuclear ribonucleoprotein 27 kDa protein n=1 Tax=Necator americanus TaxID=51031 RepID=A0ABR1BPA0_NECAM